MKAAVYTGLKQIDYGEIPAPMVGPGQVLIHVARASICGTDLSIYNGKHPRARAPLVMGHEFAGTVHALGEGVGSGLAPGIASRPTPCCGVAQCEACLGGNNHVCRTLRLVGIDVDGAFAEYVTMAAERVHKLTGNVSWEEAALIEPVAVAVHAVRCSSLRAGQTALVIGAGPIGVLVGAMARLAGARQVWIVDVVPWRLERRRRVRPHTDRRVGCRRGVCGARGYGRRRGRDGVRVQREPRCVPGCHALLRYPGPDRVRRHPQRAGPVGRPGCGLPRTRGPGGTRLCECRVRHRDLVGMCGPARCEAVDQPLPAALASGGRVGLRGSANRLEGSVGRRELGRSRHGQR